jgi:cell wall-associated NlpC family hydrolase
MAMILPFVPPLKFNIESAIAALTGTILWTVDTDKLVDLVTQMRAAGIGYHLGSKAALGAPISTIQKIDCSGFVRYAIYYASGGSVKMPDGSWVQDEWCKKQGFTSVPYKRDACLGDDRLRIAFMHGTAIGHVWFILNGQTIESHGGVGPDRRDWATPILVHNVSTCYALT